MVEASRKSIIARSGTRRVIRPDSDNPVRIDILRKVQGMADDRLL